jgi:DNA-binding PadR family transcriptional regulator
MYGYEITQKAKELTRGELIIKEGTLYPLLHKMESEGILISEVEHVENRLRKYYTLTPTGKKKTKKSMAELSAFIQTIQMLLSHKTA